MADYTWPSETIPPDFLNGTALDYTGENIIRQQMDGGVAKVRRRTSALSATLNCNLILTDTQVLVLTLWLGSISLVSLFDITVPMWDVSYDCRFLQLPKFVLLVGGLPAAIGNDGVQPPACLQRKWSVTFVLEIVN